MLRAKFGEKRSVTGPAKSNKTLLFLSVHQSAGG